MDELSRAYATLGLPPTASLAEFRKRYKALVRKWHPDRFANDPQGQSEATLRMRAINDAFRCVVAHRAASPAAAEARVPSPSASEYGRRLTREEIDRMVEAMKNDGPLDWLLGESWKEEVKRPVSRSHVASYIALGAWFLAPIFAEIVGLVPVGGPSPFWMGAFAGALAFALAMRFLPKQ